MPSPLKVACVRPLPVNPTAAGLQQAYQHGPMQPACLFLLVLTGSNVCVCVCMCVRVCADLTSPFSQHWLMSMCLG